MASPKMNATINQRRYTRTKVTKITSKISNIFDSLTVEQGTAYMDRLGILSTDLEQCNKVILEKKIGEDTSEDDIARMVDEDDHYDDLIESCLIRLKTLCKANEQVTDNGTINRGQIYQKLKLPQVSFPVFGNKKGENLQKFLAEFEGIISKHGFGSYERFVYLKKQCYGPPGILVDSLDVTQQSYEIARELLVKAFDSALTSKYNIIQRLSELKLPSGTEPYNFIGEMRTVMSSVESLAITKDEIIQFFVWQGLNSDFQSHIISITNKSKPSLKEITESIFEATERYNKQLERKTSKPKISSPAASATAMAINIQTSKTKMTCFLCGSDKKPADHSMASCPNYNTAKKKTDKLSKLKACTKCSFRNHATQDCQFKFKSNCRHCQGHHMSYLCLSPQQSSLNTLTTDSSADLGDSEAVEAGEASADSSSDEMSSDS